MGVFTKVLNVLVLLNTSILVFGQDIVSNEEKETLKNILICVDPGLSGFPVRSADKMVPLLREKGFNVSITKSDFKPEEISNLNAIIITGPVYTGNPSGYVQKILKEIPENSAYSVLIYLTYGINLNDPKPVIEKIVKERNLNLTAYSGFNQLNEGSDTNGWAKSIKEFVEFVK